MLNDFREPMEGTCASLSYLVFVEGSNFFKTSYYKQNMWF